MLHRAPRSIRGLLISLAVLALPLTLTAGSNEPTLTDVLERVGRYVVQYSEQMGLVIGVEHYTQEAHGVERGGKQITTTRTLVSEFALVRVNDWVGFRDVGEVDGAPVRERTDRIRTIFNESPATALAQWRRIADESARFNIGSIQRNFNTPTVALFFIQPANQGRFRFKKAGQETIDGVPVWKVQYEEKTRPTIIRTSSGENRPVAGMLWVDPSNGRIFRTAMTIEVEVRLSTGLIVGGGAPTPVTPRTGSALPSGWGGLGLDRTAESKRRSSASITVSYSADAGLGLMVPSEMRESYSKMEFTDTTARATYSEFRRFETGTTFKVVK
jgi:hypothetical protein